MTIDGYFPSPGCPKKGSILNQKCHRRWNADNETAGDQKFMDH